MGGGMKGHGGGSYNSRNRSYMLMLLLAFGAAIFGVMLLHKLRERRIFNILANQKDQQIFSLHLLLQKEREQAQEAKMKIEDMKVKIYNLRTQKTKLNGKLSEMHSTISSLKDEQRALELAFQEMQNEAKLLKHKSIEVNDRNPQVIALSEILQQKEAEIEDLKRHLKLPVKVWSVSTDDASNSSVNLTTTRTNVSTSGEIKVNGIQDENGNMHESANREETQNSTDGASKYRVENGMLMGDTRERTEEDKSEKMEGSRKSDFGYGKIEVGKRSDPKDATDSQNEEVSLQIGEKRKGENETVTAVYLSREEQKPRDENSELQSTDDKKLGTLAEFGLLRRIPDSQGGENEELSGNHKGGMKLEMKRNSHNGRYTLRGKHGHLRRTTGKRWRTIIKHHVNFSFQRKNESTLENHEFKVSENVPIEKPDHVKPKDGEDMSQKVVKVETHEVEKGLEVNLSNSEDSRSYTPGKIQKAVENGQSKEQDTIIQQHIEDKDDYEVDNNSGQKEVADKNDIKMEGVKETGTESSTKESTSSLEEESEEQKDEPEF
ncbi:Uncharacterized protein Adt_42208 [Abeliophyllum distichum]|uniref:Micronuclear linker histone polyprotein-like protein n=1 Tax=Abeliophyllum distichum TaxID=126358 RepID=A0ABD1PRX1_9LAMI